MDFLSKLLRGDKKEIKKAAGGIMSSLADGLFTDKGSPAAEAAHTAPESGPSWGRTMPDEENQYNYGGTFLAYFESIFREVLPGWRMEKFLPANSKRIVYTFYADAAPALVVELMSDVCSVRKVREDCARARIPYLRFYYDHEGWWNTRTYVVKRIRDAVGL